MQHPKYNLITNESATIFEFDSVGNKGQYRKVILFSETNDKGIYNLSFGDKIVRNDSFSIDDTVVSNNGDRNMILASVAQAVILFTEKKPDAYVFFKGLTPARTRLYRMAITSVYDELSLTFNIFGAILNEKGKVTNVSFDSESDFFGFIIKRK